MLPDCKIRNFTSDWNSGIALAALLDYCRPGLFPDWQRLRPENGNLDSNKCLYILLLLNISCADEVNKLLGVKPSRLSVQTTSCLWCWNNIYIFASNAFPHLAQTHQPPHKHKKKPGSKSFYLPGLENTKRAMDIAEREFKIPQVAKYIKTSLSLSSL